MRAPSAEFFALLCALSQVAAQIEPFDPTNIVGTWSSGSQAVQTGPGFANPVESTFTYPATAGISYSFSEDGYFEEALYRFQGNGTDPRCIIGVVQFQHGTYVSNADGSLDLEPFAQDGRQQVQDPCAAESNVLRQFNQTTHFGGWAIFQDPQGRDKLHIFAFDMSPFAPMFRVSATPTMLPTRVLTNTTIGTVANKLKRNVAISDRPTGLVGLATAALLSVGFAMML